MYRHNYFVGGLIFAPTHNHGLVDTECWWNEIRKSKHA